MTFGVNLSNGYDTAGDQERHGHICRSSERQSAAAALSGLVGSRTREPHIRLFRDGRAKSNIILPAQIWPAGLLGISGSADLAVGKPGPGARLLEPPYALVEAFTLLLAFPSVCPFPNDPFQIKARIGVVFVDGTGSNRVVEGMDLARQYVRRLIESAITIGCREPDRVGARERLSPPGHLNRAAWRGCCQVGAAPEAFGR